MKDLLGQDVGHYHINELFNQSSLSASYLATDTRLDYQVVLKTVLLSYMSPESALQTKKDIQQRAKTTAQFTHANIIPTLDFGEFEDVYYFVRKYIGGETLKEQIQRAAQPMFYSQATQLLLPAVRMLDTAHRKGVFHQNLKPANILLTKEGEMLLVDFGFTNLLMCETPLARIITLADGPEYLAPEQWTSRQGDARTDIYALGAIYYELITGKPLYQGESVEALMQRILSDPIPNACEMVAGLPGNINEILSKALQKDPQNRYQSAVEFEAALNAVTQNIFSAKAASLLAGLSFKSLAPSVSSSLGELTGIEPDEEIPATQKRLGITTVSEEDVTLPDMVPAELSDMIEKKRSSSGGAAAVDLAPVEEEAGQPEQVDEAQAPVPVQMEAAAAQETPQPVPMEAAAAQETPQPAPMEAVAAQETPQPAPLEAIAAQESLKADEKAAAAADVYASDALPPAVTPLQKMTPPDREVPEKSPISDSGDKPKPKAAVYDPNSTLEEPLVVAPPEVNLAKTTLPDAPPREEPIAVEQPGVNPPAAPRGEETQTAGTPPKNAADQTLPDGIAVREPARAAPAPKPAAQPVANAPQPAPKPIPQPAPQPAARPPQPVSAPQVRAAPPPAPRPAPAPALKVPEVLSAPSAALMKAKSGSLMTTTRWWIVAGIILLALILMIIDLNKPAAQGTGDLLSPLAHYAFSAITLLRM